MLSSKQEESAEQLGCFMFVLLPFARSVIKGFAECIKQLTAKVKVEKRNAFADIREMNAANK